MTTDQAAELLITLKTISDALSLITVSLALTVIILSVRRNK